MSKKLGLNEYIYWLTHEDAVMDLGSIETARAVTAQILRACTNLTLDEALARLARPLDMTAKCEVCGEWVVAGATHHCPMGRREPSPSPEPVVQYEVSEEQRQEIARKVVEFNERPKQEPVVRVDRGPDGEARVEMVECPGCKAKIIVNIQHRPLATEPVVPPSMVSVEDVESVKRALQNIMRLDKTEYGYDGKRAANRDGELPGKGKTWLTPREIAENILRNLAQGEQGKGADNPDRAKLREFRDVLKEIASHRQIGEDTLARVLAYNVDDVIRDLDAYLAQGEGKDAKS